MDKKINKAITTKLPKSRQNQARLIISAVSNGEPYQNFHGKRFKWNRSLIGVPLGKHFRIVFQEEQSKIIPWRVLTHSEYNRMGKP